VLLGGHGWSWCSSRRSEHELATQPKLLVATAAAAKAAKQGSSRGLGGCCVADKGFWWWQLAAGGVGRCWLATEMVVHADGVLLTAGAGLIVGEKKIKNAFLVFSF